MEIYVLQVGIGKQKYYVTDLSGSLSRNVMDSMLFFDEISATSYSGPIEHLVEEKTGVIATISVVSPPLSGVVPKTVFECISCP